MGKLSRENMPNAYKEVHEILKYVGEEERNLIPESFYNLIDAKMNKEYQYNYDETKEFKDQEMLMETRAILGHIYLNYWADEEEKKVIENKLKNDIKKADELKREKYDPNSIFKSVKEETKKDEAKEIEEEVKALVEVKESFLTKVINKIKEFFKINK
jgi:hypothetical protein